jgi:Lipocalin-like domain
LLGSWRLVSCVTEAADGSVDYPLGEDAVGLLTHTEDGHMSLSFARATGTSAHMRRSAAARVEAPETRSL